MTGRFAAVDGARAAAPPQALIMAPGFVIRSLDPGHTLEPDGEMITHACYDALVTSTGRICPRRGRISRRLEVSAGGLLSRSRFDETSGLRAAIR